MTPEKTAAVILAAGPGVRMKSKRPKVAHEILGRPLVQWVLDAAAAAGIDRLVSVVGHAKDQVIPLVQDVSEVVVQEVLNGTAGALLVCADAFSDFEGSLVVLSADCPMIKPQTIKQLLDARAQSKAAAVVLTMNLHNPEGYGRIIRDGIGRVERIVEHKDATDEQRKIRECNAGIYCFDSRVVFEALKKVESETSRDELYLTDVVEVMRRENREVCACIASDARECFGVNSQYQLAVASKALQQLINEAHMEAGVSFLAPDLAWIGPDVKLSSDVRILQNVMLTGNTVVGEDSVIGPNTRLRDTVVGRGCTIDETVAVKAQIDDFVTCGPRAYLREGSHLCEGSKAGTHVEIKKSTIGKGSKVPHLSYIGDTQMGEGVNIGAGTITCNYDGVNKHSTIIGDHVFVGSDTMLVAPVKVGDGSIIGAGSVITKEVTPDALALTRPQQVEIDQWAVHKRASQAEARAKKQAQKGKAND